MQIHNDCETDVSTLHELQLISPSCVGRCLRACSQDAVALPSTCVGSSHGTAIHHRACMCAENSSNACLTGSS